jgi:predicted transcriptional regulator
MTPPSLQIQGAIASRLDHLAKQRNLSPEDMAASAIEESLDREEWQIAEIQAGLWEAEQGDFASAEDVATVLAKLAGSRPPER